MRLKKMTVIAVAAAVLAAAAGAVWALKPGQPAEIAQMGVSPRDGRIYGLGTVEAKTLSRLGFELAGTVADLTADQGDAIQRGQPLARLDARHQQAKVGQAEAALRQAQAALTQAQSRLERAQTIRVQRESVNKRRQALVQRGTVSAEVAEDARTTSATSAADVLVAASDVEAARGGVDAARALMQLEQAMLDKYTIAAPYDGVVVERLVELGAASSPGVTVFTVADPATVWVRAFVDEALAGGLRVGQKVEISLRSQPGRSFPGRIARIDIENDRVSEERRVHVAFDDVPRPFYLGEQAEILIQTEEPQS